VAFFFYKIIYLWVRLFSNACIKTVITSILVLNNLKLIKFLFLLFEYVLLFFSSKYQKPTKKEGIVEIVPINFVPYFKDPDHEKLYKMFLL